MDNPYYLDPDYVQNSLAFLKKHDSTGIIFQSSSHKYILKPPAKEGDVAEFEKSRSIQLPLDYRRFLTEIGNGGAGPYYGVLGINELQEPTIEGYDDPSKPFPYLDAWNGRPGEMAKIAAAYETYEEEVGNRYGELVDAYWHYATRNGSLKICEFGCNLCFLLVVNGKEFGHIWFDEVADIRGYSPVIFDRTDVSTRYAKWRATDPGLQGLPRLTFSEWYACWLDWACRSVDDYQQQRLPFPEGN